MSKFAGALMAVFCIVTTSPTIASDWLPLTKSQIISLTVGSANTESLKIELISDQTKLMKTKGLAVDESVWVAANGALAMGFLMAGKDEKIHTIRIPVFTLGMGMAANQQKVDRLSKLMSDLFSSIYPDWPEAKDWPMTSLKAAWDMNPLVTNKIPSDPEDKIIKKNLHGITSATFGVPPDIVIYTITVRDGCIPNVREGNPFDRLIC